MILFEPSRDVAGHCAVALVRHRDQLHRDGRSAPDGFDELLATFVNRASPGQAETAFDALAAAVDDAPMAPLLLTRADAGRLLGVSERTVQRLAASGAFPIVKVEGAARIRREDVERYVAGLASDPADHPTLKEAS